MSLFCWTQRKIFWRMWETEQFWGTIDFHSIFFPTMEGNGAPKQPGYKLSSKYLPLCSAEQRNSYRFGTTWGWVNDDRIFIFGWTIPLRGDCIIPLRQSNFSQSAFSVKAAREWNTIPTTIRDLDTYALFRVQLKNWLTSTQICQH